MLSVLVGVGGHFPKRKLVTIMEGTISPMEISLAGQWWHRPLTPSSPGRKRQKNLCELEANRVYSASFKTARETVLKSHRKRLVLAHGFLGMEIGTIK